MRKMKKCFVYLAIMFMMVQVFGSNTVIPVYAEITEETTQTVAKVPQKPIDIVLSVGSSYLGLDNFEQDLKAALEAKGVDLSCVRIKTFDGVEISSNQADAQKIFTTWKSFPFNSAIYWRYDSRNKWITTSYNEPYETGYIDMTGGYIKDFSMTANCYGPDYQQPLGFVFRVRPSEKYPGRWDLYYFWSSDDSYGSSEKVFAIFKVEAQNLDAATRPNWSGTYSATPLMRFSGKYFGWPYHQPYDYGGYPNYTPYKVGVTVSNKADPTMKTTTLAIGSIPRIGGNVWFNLNLNVNGNHFTASINDKTVLDVVDEDNPYTEGYYGIFSYSHVGPIFRDIGISQKRYKSFKETIDETQWREGSTRILINLNDKKEEAFSTEGVAQEILEKMKAEGIFYVGWGNETNVKENEDFINKNGGNGITVDTSDYAEAIGAIADYVEVRGHFQEGSGTINDPYIVRTAYHLNCIRYYPGAYFRLEEDIDYTGYTWTSIGSSDTPFTGYVDGNGHTVSHVTIGGTLDGAAGFFGVIKGGTVTNLTFNHLIVTGGDFVGGVAGHVYGGSKIIKCYMYSGEIIGSSYVGGLCGYAEDSQIEDSEASVEVYGKVSVGGIAGFTTNHLIKDCISCATITGLEKIGGIIGSCSNTRMENCLSFANVVGNHSVGGLIGLHNGTVSEESMFEPAVVDSSSFATVKGAYDGDGLIGVKENSTVENCEDYATVETGEEKE